MGKKLKSLRSKIQALREDLAELWKAVHGKPKPENVGKGKKGKKAAKASKPKKGKKAASHKAAGKGPGSAKKGAGAVKKSGPASGSVPLSRSPCDRFLLLIR